MRKKLTQRKSNLSIFKSDVHSSHTINAGETLEELIQRIKEVKLVSIP